MSYLQKQPKSAFIAVTLLCNSRCVMCDIWKNKGIDYLDPKVYQKIPSSLEMIDITGGEPFLRPDIPEVLAVLREKAPKARILITTHGFMTDKIQKQLAALLKVDSELAFRISIDGLGAKHDEIRGIPNAFEKASGTLQVLKSGGVKDLGITFTLMRRNQDSLFDVYNYSKKNGYSFSLNAVHDSPVYFGEGKEPLNADVAHVRPAFKSICEDQLRLLTPKSMGKAWFYAELFKYMETHKRAFSCGAGEDFFYLDSAANVYMCHFKNWPIGNLQNQMFEEIWASKEKNSYLPMAAHCEDCWLICTAKDGIKKNKWRVLKDLVNLPKYFKKETSFES